MDMIYGIVILAFITVIAIIGVFSDTKNRPGFKWFLVLLVLAGAAAGGARLNYIKEAAEKDKKKLDDAVELAKSSNKLAEEEMKSHQADVQNFGRQRDRLEADYLQLRKGTLMLIGQIASMMKQLEELEQEIAKTKSSDLAEIGVKARLDTSKNLVSIAKDAQWMDPTGLTKMEALLKDDKPLKPKHLTTLQNALKSKPMATEE